MKKEAIKKNNKLRHNEYYNMQEVFDELYTKSKNGINFHNIMNIIEAEENILLAYRNIKKNTGSNTSGIDGKTIDYLGKMTTNELINKVQYLLKNYKPKAVKRIEIPKPNGDKRPLGIPTILDRLVQQCILQVLEPICEAKFYDQSYGFRPARSAEHAIANIYKRIQFQKLYYVVDVDIKGFFDNINHDKLIRQMWTIGIRDKKLICIIKAMLKAKIIMPNGEIVKPTKGTPQGGILSPLLANIVLNELDWWIVSNWQNVKTKREYTKTIQKNGQITEHHKYEHLKKTTHLKEMWITRYADDFKIFCRTQEDAEKTYIAVKDWIKHRLKLEINEEKSQVTNLIKQNTNFLGFDIGTQKKRGKYVVESHVSKKALKRIYQNVKEQIKILQRPINSRQFTVELNKYNSMIIGIHNYYSMATAVAEDFSKLGYQINFVLYNRLRNQISKEGKINNKYISKRYGKSNQIKFINNIPILPIGYVSFDIPIAKKYIANIYTKEGRECIHKQLNMSKDILKELYENPVPNRSTEYNDNRISKYIAQKGKCSVTGEILDIKDMQCHHKIPRDKNGTDSYNNLTLVTHEVHILIHATNTNIINKHLQCIKTKEQLEKLNKLRKIIGNKEITF